ncbi:uncharacterized protein LOC113232470 isoform X2 [Hyposmocoma kahamanoa]|uniref:uncharacterized protein LOC113232470 isoform X2 n=1 Tax=Hyposmocoma kahamanoa TaxID=1477025 RepID=UPI000E6D60F8|nr:uncharacterized protein LOC113232470 isoform X2 [Hyposmocoma kahamanoa]
MIYLKIFTFTLCFVFIVDWVCSRRRVLNGHKVHSVKPYMVYLVKHQWSHAFYEGWLCGGAIIHPLHVLTSATCVKDVYNIYVISGLKQYISNAYTDDNKCVRRTRRRIVSLCEFKSAEYNVTDFYTYNSSSDNGFPHSTSWAMGNLGLARINSPFAFHSNDYTTYCDYKPQIVSVNFLNKYERPGIQGILLGWGNRRFYRPRGDLTIYNEKDLRYTSVVVVNKSRCVEKYSHTKLNLTEDETLLCIDGQGILNDYGLPNDYDDTCFNCEETEPPDSDRRRWYAGQNTRPRITTLNWLNSYGNGPCQNDQGGPLVVWIGGRETVIGVASAFMVTAKMECKGPFIFASTACSSELIFCIISSKLRRSAEYCESVAQRSGVRIYQTYMDWNTTSLNETGKKAIKHGPATYYGYYRTNNKPHVTTTTSKMTQTGTKRTRYVTLHEASQMRAETLPETQPGRSRSAEGIDKTNDYTFDEYSENVYTSSNPYDTNSGDYWATDQQGTQDPNDLNYYGRSGDYRKRQSNNQQERQDKKQTTTNSKPSNFTSSYNATSDRTTNNITTSVTQSHSNTSYVQFDDKIKHI